ncbi:glycosyltransferase family 4 protein [Shouchella patagoniensis]|uniref:glycosyltransferase family 4 protein n=1 Tax=Shouchella patagoniensis TaxID=228576 RepID=UPI00099521EE|nr:glycosyltransferase family 4 protein [Shouchella patagoniensis]
MKKKYLAIGPLPPPIGGDTISFSRLINSESIKDEVELIIFDTSRKDKESKISRKLQLSDLFNGIKFLRGIWVYRKKVDGVLLWANSRFAYTMGFLIILLFKLYKKQIVLKLFGTSFTDHYKNRIPGFYKKAINIIFNKVDFILPQTENLRRFFIDEVGLNAEKVVQLPNFLSRTPQKKIIDSRDKGVNSIFVGQVKQPKGVMDILEVLEKDSTISCDFYGTIFNKDKEEFLSRVQKLNNAHYKGEIPGDSVVETISQYDILLLPTTYAGEGYPGVILEAFFAGVPVISTKWKDIPELVSDGVNGMLINVNSPTELHLKLKSIINFDYYRNLSEGAHKTAYMYTEEEVIKKILIPILTK